INYTHSPYTTLFRSIYLYLTETNRTRQMYIKTLIFAAITLVFTSFPAFAATPQVHQLRTMTSQPGQSKVAFLVDVAHWMRAWSDKTGFEVCAAIATSGSRYGVVITPSRAHIACLIDYTKLVVGMHYADTTIHTHPKPGRYFPNHLDRVMNPHPITSSQVAIVSTTLANHFSAEDVAAGPGYLVG